MKKYATHILGYLLLGDIACGELLVRGGKDLVKDLVVRLLDERHHLRGLLHVDNHVLVVAVVHTSGVSPLGLVVLRERDGRGFAVNVTGVRHDGFFGSWCVSFAGVGTKVGWNNPCNVKLKWKDEIKCDVF